MSNLRAADLLTTPQICFIIVAGGVSDITAHIHPYSVQLPPFSLLLGECMSAMIPMVHPHHTLPRPLDIIDSIKCTYFIYNVLYADVARSMLPGTIMHPQPVLLLLPSGPQPVCIGIP